MLSMGLSELTSDMKAVMLTIDDIIFKSDKILVFKMNTGPFRTYQIVLMAAFNTGVVANTATNGQFIGDLARAVVEAKVYCNFYRLLHSNFYCYQFQIVND